MPQNTRYHTAGEHTWEQFANKQFNELESSLFLWKKRKIVIHCSQGYQIEVP